MFTYSVRSLITLQRLLMTGLIVLGTFTLNAQAATVSVSNYPLFLLSEAVTEARHQPIDYCKRGRWVIMVVSAGDIKAIKDSKFVVWFGEPLENNLAASLKTAPNAIALFEFDAFNRHPLRDVKGDAIAGTLDPHIWLDPENAKAITRALAVIHSHANPQYKDLYQANAKKICTATRQRSYCIAKLYSKCLKTRPYWAYHDAYQYIEDSLHLTLVGSLSVDHHLSPKASQLRWLNEQRPAKQMCLISPSEPAKGLLAKLQPVKSTVQPEDMSSSDDFISGWQNMAKQIYQCIS
ncbi:LOW QUALITY PROTEIN: zinc ABC transporter, periplasmic-binding protein ZnuA [Psychrobacter sp. JCM 18900]|nr:LOW QUALITY PROTEIN: zinc ABC transporter, periplasmic-binding protein ZnuA [Psychrobacter sp. JCM 18900]